MSRGGREKDHDDPERRCIVSGESGPKNGLIRFVVGPEGQLVPDLNAKLPGRGIYVTAERAAIETAVKKKLFTRAAKGPVTVPEGLADLLEGALARRLVDTVSLARKAGLAICGFEKVKAALGNEQVKVLLQASDGSDRGKGKLWTPEGSRWFGCLTAAELGSAFGRDAVIHAALGAGGLTRRVVEEAAKLAGFRGIDGSATAGKDI